MSGPTRHDVVVVGAGPAGLAAAVAASERGRSVLVLDQAPHAGGQVWRHRRGERPAPVLVELLRRLAARGGAIARRAAVLDCPAPGELVVDFDGRIDRITAPALVLATGAVERLLPFPGWTLPGVTGVGGLQALLKAGLALRGQRVVIAGTGPLLLPAAATVVKGGGELVMIAEQARGSQVVRFAGRALTDPARLLQALRLRMATIASPYRADSWVVAAHGEDRVREVTVHVQGAERVIACDWLAAAAGLLPRTELAELLGCALAGGGDGGGIIVDDDQGTSVPGIWAAGECCGVKGETAGMAEGTIAGCMAADAPTTIPPRTRKIQAAGRRFGGLLEAAFAPRPELLRRVTPETIVCRCEDVPAGAIDPAWSPRQAKLWTRAGMGSCQGAVCGPACTALYGWGRNAVRPPLASPPLGAWAGALTRDGEPTTQ